MVHTQSEIWEKFILPRGSSEGMLEGVRGWESLPFSLLVLSKLTCNRSTNRAGVVGNANS